ncbi:MAG: hypothetical protein N2117_00460 [Anaerolineales bacterium]|nr:hypothetical protein [Anaerolineales bacterium]
MRNITLTLLLFALFFGLVSPAQAADPIRVYYAGQRDSVYTALTLAPAGTFAFVDDPLQADVFVLNGEIPPDERIARQIESGAGVVLLLAPGIDSAQAQRVTGIALTLRATDSPISVTQAKGSSDPLVTGIVWNSAPQLRERYQVESPVSSLIPLVMSYETGDWILFSHRERVFLWTAWLGENNRQIQEWAYFNYLVYHLTVRAAGQTPLPFAEYPASPIPHAVERNLIVGAVLTLVALTLVAFFFVRRYSLAHPEVLDRIVADRADFQTRQEQTAWEEVGFHRPLSGFLLALAMGIVLFIPLIIYQNLILPNYILPSAQALGTWGRVTQFFNLMWTFFDMGTSLAFIKYLSEYRVHDPRRGIQFGQLFVWWQAISGAIQVALVIALTATYAPSSAFALYTWSVIVHALIQVPGFYQVFRHALTGFQRQDYSRALDLAVTMFPLVVQPIVVTLMYRWGTANPVYGGVNGGVIGMGIAAYLVEFLTFLLGLWLYRRIGYNAGILFLAHFDWETVRTSLRFGVFAMVGSMAWAAGQAAEIAITQARLVNYAEIWGNWGMAQNFIFAFNIVAILFDGTMAAVSEAVSSGKRLLAQYYSAMMYKWGALMSAFLGAVLLAVGPKFILGATGVEFERAAVYILPLAVWGALQYPSWVSDQVALGADKPWLKALMVFGEQVLRVALVFLLLERFQVTGLIIAYLIALNAKNITAYFVNHRLCYPQKFYAWQSLFAPLLAAAAHYLVLDFINNLVWRDDQVTSILIFFIGILPSFPVYLFFYGLAGGWDDDTLAEFRQAVELSGFTRPLAWVMWKASELGARLSPLTGRFPITIRAAAMDEARALTEERVRL